MKQGKGKLLLLILLTVVFITACQDEPYTHTKTIESEIYNEIKTHRTNNGLGDPFVFQLIMTREAQAISTQISYNTKSIDTTGISDHWKVIHDKIGGVNEATLLQITSDSTAIDIVANWTADSLMNTILLGDYSQCGVGVEYDNDNLACVTVMMMLVE